MKAKYKKLSATALGIISGIFVPGSFIFAELNGRNSPGDPYRYPGETGAERVTTARGTGRFKDIQHVGLEIIRIMETIIVPFIMSLALLAFLWGILQFIRKGDDPKEREQGRQFMLWGIIGLAVMASVWALVRILTNTLGVPLGIPSIPSR